MIRRVAGLAIVLVGIIVLFPFAFTVVPIEAKGSLDQGFDPAAFVDGIWGDIETKTKTDAADMATLLPAIAPDAKGFVGKDELAKVTSEHGLITPGEAHVFLVKVTGTVSEVDTSSSVGTMTVSIDGYDGPITVKVYLGPRIPSDDSSIRDAVGFITFGDFKDQTEYGKVASEINARIVANLKTLDASRLEGEPVTVVGALTIRTFNLVQIDVSTLRVVPIAVTVG